MKIEKYSFGMGDRFEKESEAQLGAIIDAQRLGVQLTPVWNKSNREHLIVKSEPSTLRLKVDAAVSALGWTGPYRIDADHINGSTVDRFLEACDFYTIDVSDHMGDPADESEIESFCSDCGKYFRTSSMHGFPEALVIDLPTLRTTAQKFLVAIQEAGRIYRKIEKVRGKEAIIEVSVDETDTSQTPAELLIILAMLAREKVPCQTIAPKFIGRFNKGVDYLGDVARFEKEFEEHIYVVEFAIREFGLPETLKLSLHSGSDKFSLYPIINRALRKHDAGVHVKTAGTTWLEEVIGLSESGRDGLKLAQEIYCRAYGRLNELIGPYASVVEIDPTRLPSPQEVRLWNASKFCSTLRHNPSAQEYSSDFRQLLHVSFKVAAEMGSQYLSALETNRKIIAKNVRENLLRRHILPIFGN